MVLNLIKITIFLLSLSLVASCVVEDTTSNETGETEEIAIELQEQPNKSFSLKKLQSTDIGSNLYFELTGSDSIGNSYTGSIRGVNREKIEKYGMEVTPFETMLSLNNGELALSVNSITYTDENGYLISSVVPNDNLICIPSTPDKLPDFVKSRDFGMQSTLICNNETIVDRNWEADLVFGDSIDITLYETTKNSNNSIITTVYIEYTIDITGEITSIRTQTTDVYNHFTLSLSSK